MTSTTKRLATLVAATALAVGVSGIASSGNAAIGVEAATGVSTTVQTTPVGTWKGTVQHAGGGGAITLTFLPNGLACLASGDGGGAGGKGVGTWKSTGTNKFTYRIWERLHDGGGATTGYVDVNQSAVQTANTFNSTGTSRIYDPNGVFVSAATAKVSVTRVSGPALC